MMNNGQSDARPARGREHEVGMSSRVEQAAELLLREEGFSRLKASIEEHHVLVPVVGCFNTGEIIDGRLRLRACRELGIECPVDWTWFADDADREATRRALNLARQHLGPAARDAWEGGG